MLISTYSKSPHFDPNQPDAHVPTYRDEVGLVRAIVVKVWITYLVQYQGYSLLLRNARPQSEKKCGRLFKPRQIKGVPFNWFLTWRYVGHQCIWCLIVPREKKRYVAYFIQRLELIVSYSQCVDTFVDELRWEEQDSSKRDKIRELKLTGEEWGRVNMFLGLLSVR
jgi:hypothetical protein